MSENGELTEAQVQWQTKMDDLKQQIQGQSEAFTKDIFQKVIQPVVMGKVLPLIDKECAVQLKGLTPKDKVTVAKFTQTMAVINDKIL